MCPAESAMAVVLTACPNRGGMTPAPGWPRRFGPADFFRVPLVSRRTQQRATAKLLKAIGREGLNPDDLEASSDRGSGLSARASEGVFCTSGVGNGVARGYFFSFPGNRHGHDATAEAAIELVLLFLGEAALDDTSAILCDDNPRHGPGIAERGYARQPTRRGGYELIDGARALSLAGHFEHPPQSYVVGPTFLDASTLRRRPNPGPPR